MELNEYGMRVWKHKTNKRLFLQQSYSWVDRLTLIDETEGRQIIMDFKVSTFDFYAWTPVKRNTIRLNQYIKKFTNSQVAELVTEALR